MFSALRPRTVARTCRHLSSTRRVLSGQGSRYVPELEVRSTGKEPPEQPKTELANGSDPLVAPVKLSRKLVPTERAAQRFQVEGNAIVTGGSGGLGMAAVRALLEHGASGLCILDIQASIDMASPDLEKLRKDFPEATIITKGVDVSKEDSVRNAVDATSKELGGVHMMLCFAGVVQAKHAIEMNPDDWQRTIDINLTGSWYCAQAAARQMIAQESGGSIVLAGSISGHIINFPQPQVHYNVSKAGIIHLAHGLAAEWARYGIRVNSVSPGYMDTIMTRGEGLKEEREMWMSQNPMGRLGSPDELVGAIILLCSKVAGKYMTGTDIVVDGGESVF